MNKRDESPFLNRNDPHTIMRGISEGNNLVTNLLNSYAQVKTQFPTLLEKMNVLLGDYNLYLKSRFIRLKKNKNHHQE